jgi:hypothetical protein
MALKIYQLCGASGKVGGPCRLQRGFARDKTLDIAATWLDRFQEQQAQRSAWSRRSCGPDTCVCSLHSSTQAMCWNETEGVVHTTPQGGWIISSLAFWLLKCGYTLAPVAFAGLGSLNRKV